MRWSVGIEAEGHQVLTREQIVELADAVAAFDGIATGIGTTRYGAQIVVEAASQEAAIEAGMAAFRRAAATASLPESPIVRAEAISEAEDQAEFASAGPASPGDPDGLPGTGPARGFEAPAAPAPAPEGRDGAAEAGG